MFYGKHITCFRSDFIFDKPYHQYVTFVCFTFLRQINIHQIFVLKHLSTGSQSQMCMVKTMVMSVCLMTKHEQELSCNPEHTKNKPWLLCKKGHNVICYCSCGKSLHACCKRISSGAQYLNLHLNSWLELSDHAKQSNPVNPLEACCDPKTWM